MTAMELYEALDALGIPYEVVEIFENVRLVSFEVEEKASVSDEVEE